MTSEPFSLYVHIPFCAQKCPYCDFNTYAVKRVPEHEYVQALCRELELFADDPRFAGRPLSTIFFGGGTPSMLSSEAIRRVIDRARELFSLCHEAEVTLEANPSGVSKAAFVEFREAGINRISFGVQSFSNKRLALLGRDHTASDATEAVHDAVSAGITNLSIDLIFGVPNQTMSDVEEDVQCALALPIQHLSAYALTIEPGTPFFQRQERGLLSMPRDGVVAEMLERIPQMLADGGLQRYEISNYALPSFESRHNTVYWTGGDYLGIGAGAHSYVANRDGERLLAAERWSTAALPQTYMESISRGSAIAWRDSLTIAALQFEYIYLGLRMTHGVGLREYERRFGESIESRWGDVVRALVDEGFILCMNDRLQLTARGINVSDSIFERFA